MTADQDNRRAYPRFELTCPITVTDSEGNPLLKTRTLNVSDGGALLAPHEETLDVGESVDVTMNLPRSTPNTFMFEQVTSPAQVVRSQQADDLECLALMFIEPLELALDEGEPGAGSREPGRDP